MFTKTTRLLVCALALLTLTVTPACSQPNSPAPSDPGSPPGGGGTPAPPAGPPPPPASVLARLDCQGGAAFPECGASRSIGNDSVGVNWRRSYVAAEDAIEITIVPGSTGEGYYGWSFEGIEPPRQGETRAFRFRLKLMPPIQWGSWGAKVVILGDREPSPDDQRVIATMEMFQGQPNINIDQNINGFYASTLLSADVYTALQFVVEPVTAGTTNPYRFRLYKDGALVSTSRNFNLNPTQWNDFGIGFYGSFANGAQHVRYRFRDAYYTNAYDPSFR